MTTCYGNVNNNEKVKNIRKTCNDIKSNHLKNEFRNIDIILAEKQPKNLLRLLCKPRLNTDTNNFIQPKGLFICKKNDAKFALCM